MADERTEGTGKSDAAAHAGPTIDLDASQVTERAADKTEAEETASQSENENVPPSGPAPGASRSGAGLLLAGLSGGVVALAVAGGLWFWFDGFAPASPPVTAAQFDGVSANVDALATRMAKAEIAAAVRPLLRSWTPASHEHRGADRNVELVPALPAPRLRAEGRHHRRGLRDGARACRIFRAVRAVGRACGDAASDVGVERRRGGDLCASAKAWRL